MSGSVPRYAPFLYIDTPPSRLGNSPVYPLYSPCFKALLLPYFGFLLPLLPFATWLPGKNLPRLSRSILHPFYGVRFVFFLPLRSNVLHSKKRLGVNRHPLLKRQKGENPPCLKRYLALAQLLILILLRRSQ